MVFNTSFIKVKNVKDDQLVSLLEQSQSIDKGECEAIILSKELGADYLLIDEKSGRFVAQKMKIDIMGTIGIITTALKKNLINKEKANWMLDELVNNKIRLSETLIESTKEVINNI